MPAGTRSSERTLPLTVSGTGFLLDRLGRDCAPLQFLRELTQNSIDAILRTPEQRGTVTWDVDWNTFELDGPYKLSITDTGDGMTGEEMERYINQLSSSIYKQSEDGNFGVGAKIAAATRNHAGLIYLSWKSGMGSTIHLWRDPDEVVYGLRRFERPDGSYGHWAHVEDTVKPADIGAHGTKVILLGNVPAQDTMVAPGDVPSPSRWVTYYLNTRYFRFHKGVTVRAREGWTNPRSDKDRNILRTITGQEPYLEEHAEKSGVVELTGARARWWILKDEPAVTNNSGQLASGGHVAALYQDELYELTTGRGGAARLQQFGVALGYRLVVIYVEPTTGDGIDIASNTARTHLLLNRAPLPWADWAEEFRSKTPAAIRDLVDRAAASAAETDHTQSIRERLDKIKDLFKLSRYTPTPSGTVRIDDASTEPGGAPRASESERKASSPSQPGKEGGKAGGIYSYFLKDNGVPGRPVRPDPYPKVLWVSVRKGTREPGMMEDRAALYLAETNELQINEDFRVFTDMIRRWCDKYAHVGGAGERVREVVHEWFEQSLVEAVMGIRAIKGAKEWTTEDLEKAISSEALTMAVLPRYHVEMSVSRTLGSKLGTLKDRA